MSEILAWFNPTRWAALGVIVAALAGGYSWHRNSLIQQGRDECTAERDAAAKAATNKQSGQNVQATKELVKTETRVEIRYVERAKKAAEYEAPAGTACVADADFLRDYNAR